MFGWKKRTSTIYHHKLTNFENASSNADVNMSYLESVPVIMLAH